MRLLLLLSAFLTALTGAMTGTAASAQPFAASVSVSSSVKAGVTTGAVMPLPEEAQGMLAAPGTWRAPTPLNARPSRHPFGERWRE